MVTGIGKVFLGFFACFVLAEGTCLNEKGELTFSLKGGLRMSISRTRTAAVIAVFITLLPASSLLAALMPGQVEVATFNPQLLIESESATGWREVPDYLRGSMIHSLSNGHPGYVDGGVIDFDVTESGLVYLACHWGYEGNDSGDWTDDRLLREDLFAMGWHYFDDMKAQSGRRFRIMYKTVIQGEHFQMRVNKYEPPLLMTLTDQSGTLANPLPAWPMFGALRVADFDPTALVSGNGEHGFTTIPAELEGQTIFSVERRIPGGELEFEVVDDTTVRMACHFGFEGDECEGEWSEFRQTMDDLLADGWVATGEMLTAADGRTWDVLEKQVCAGERYNIWVNKYSTPLLIVPEPVTMGLLMAGGLLMLRRRRAN
jgi:hypothetical protein